MLLESSPVDLAWQAGIMEGEGTVALTSPQDKRRTGHVRVQIANCDFQLLTPFVDWWGGYFRHRRTPPGNRKPSADWTCDSLKAERFLRAIRPYVRSDRMKARIDLALAFQKSKSSTQPGQRLGAADKAFQERCRQEMKVLNHRGAPLE